MRLHERIAALERRRNRLSLLEIPDGQGITPSSITACLMAIAEEAEQLGVPASLSVARQALMDVAKLNGLIVETHENITRSPEERSARLAELRAERERLTRLH